MMAYSDNRWPEPAAVYALTEDKDRAALSVAREAARRKVGQIVARLVGKRGGKAA